MTTAGLQLCGYLRALSIVLAVKEDRVNDETLNRIVELYQVSDAVNAAVHSACA